MSEARELPRYKCHKEVHALQILEVKLPSEMSPSTDVQLVPVEAGYSPIIVPFEWAEKNDPKAGGYYVVYSDGYASYSPAKAFEEGCSQIDIDTGTFDLSNYVPSTVVLQMIRICYPVHEMAIVTDLNIKLAVILGVSMEGFCPASKTMNKAMEQYAADHGKPLK